jgi:hypothetical protein
MGMLSEIGLVRSESSKTGRIFEQIIGNFLRISASSSHGYVQMCWQKYQETHAQEDVGTNGKFFELCIATLLVRQDILPFYMQAKIAFVPNIDYDFIMYTLDSGPICISTKTTLRERYKQADLEAVALKYVHRKAKSYLINISEVENRSLQHKIENGGVMGLDGSIYAFSIEFDKFIAQLYPNVA